MFVEQSEYERRVQLKRRIEDDALTTTLTKRQKTFSDHEAQVLADAIKSELITFFIRRIILYSLCLSI